MATDPPWQTEMLSLGPKQLSNRGPAEKGITRIETIQSVNAASKSMQRKGFDSDGITVSGSQ